MDIVKKEKKKSLVTRGQKEMNRWSTEVIWVGENTLSDIY